MCGNQWFPGPLALSPYRQCWQEEVKTLGVIDSTHLFSFWADEALTAAFCLLQLLCDFLWASPALLGPLHVPASSAPLSATG